MMDILNDINKITKEQIELLVKYNALLVKQNEVLNLTAHKTEEESLINNVYDSLLFIDCFKNLVEQFQESNNLKNSGAVKVLDIGSGGGCPAIPLKIVCPQINMTMIDSVNKKVDFLNNTIKKLGLDGIFALHTRVEDFVKDNRDRFQIVTARAVASLPTLLEYTLPFVKSGGYVLAFKGKNWQSETKESAYALGSLGGEISDIKTCALKDDIMRSLIIIKKVKETNIKYPRGKNLPRLKPLVKKYN